MSVKKITKTTSFLNKPPLKKPAVPASQVHDAKTADAGDHSAAEPTTAPNEQSASVEQNKPAAEKLAPKIRRKGDIMKALRGGAHVLHTAEGLYRIVDGENVHPSSKRRISALIDAGLLKRDPGNDHRYVFDAASEVAATQPVQEKAVANTADAS
jgi:hypothetical protein